MEVFGLAGWSGSGKTTLIKRLIPVLTDRGISVSTIKHAHHSFDIDEPGKDSFEHRLAGAEEVLISSENRWAIIHENKGFMEPELSDLLSKLSPVNLVLVEGFKNLKFQKLEIYREANKKPLLQKNDTNICAVVSDIGLTNIEVPVFGLDDIKTISEFIMQNTGLLETL